MGILDWLFGTTDSCAPPGERDLARVPPELSGKELAVLCSHNPETLIREAGWTRLEGVVEAVLRSDVAYGFREVAVEQAFERDCEEGYLSRKLVAVLLKLWDCPNDHTQDRATQALVHLCRVFDQYQDRQWFAEAKRKICDCAIAVCQSAKVSRGPEHVTGRVNGAIDILGHIGDASALAELESLLAKVDKKISRWGKKKRYLDLGWARGYVSSDDALHHLRRHIDLIRQRISSQDSE